MKRDSSLRFFQTIEKVILFLYAFDVLFDKYVRRLLLFFTDIHNSFFWRKGLKLS